MATFKTKLINKTRSQIILTFGHTDPCISPGVRKDISATISPGVRKDISATISPGVLKDTSATISPGGRHDVIMPKIMHTNPIYVLAILPDTRVLGSEYCIDYSEIIFQQSPSGRIYLDKRPRKVAGVHNIFQGIKNKISSVLSKTLPASNKSANSDGVGNNNDGLGKKGGLGNVNEARDWNGGDGAGPVNSGDGIALAKEAQLNAESNASTSLFMDIVSGLFETDENENLFNVLKEELTKIGCYISTSHNSDIESFLHQEKLSTILCCFNDKEDSFEFHFEGCESMADIVGVGLDFAKVTLEEACVLKVIQISKHEWESAWKNSGCTSKLTLTVNLRDTPEHLLHPTEDPSFIGKGRPLLWDIAKYFILQATISSLSSKDISSIDLADSSFGVTTRPTGTNQEARNSSSENVSGSRNSVHQLFQVVRAILFGVPSNPDVKNDSDPNGDPSNNLDIHAATTVYLQLLPGGCFSDENPIIDEELLLLRSQLDNTMHSQMKFIFINDPNDKRITITVETCFQFDKENEENYVKMGRYGWFHDNLDVSFHPENYAYSKLDLYKALEVEKRIETFKAGASEGSTKGYENSLSMQGKVSFVEALTLMVKGEIKSLESNTASTNVEHTRERQCEYTRGGFEIKERPDSRSSHLRYICSSPPYMVDLDHVKLSDETHRSRLDSLPNRMHQKVKFQGTWKPDSIDSTTVPQTMMKYIYEASRVVHISSKKSNENAKKTSKGKLFNFKRSVEKCNSVKEEPLISFKQLLSKDLYLNHAMTHLNGKVYKVRERVVQHQGQSSGLAGRTTYLTDHQCSKRPDWPQPLVDVNPEMPLAPVSTDVAGGS